jgi:hypothetical protein
MGEHKEVIEEKLWLKEPRTERLRKGSAGRLRHLLSTGWRETDRWPGDQYVTARFERTGVDPSLGKLPKIQPPPPRTFRDRNQGGRGGPGRGPGGPRGGGPGGPGGGPRTGGPGAPRGGAGAPRT